MKIKIALSCVLLGFSMSAYSENKPSEPVIVGQKSDLAKVMAANVRKFELPNGLRVLYYQRGDAPIFHGRVTVKVGGVDETVGQTGVAHLLEHMIFKGTDTLGVSDFAAEKKLLLEYEQIISQSGNGNTLTPEQAGRIAELKAELKAVRYPESNVDQLYSGLGGLGLNATTSADLTNYFVNLPSNAFEAWCAIEADRLENTVWREFYTERDVVLEERRMRVLDSPGGFLYQNLIAAAFDNHPYGQPVIGYEEDIKNLTATVTDEFFGKYYVPNNMVISVVGNLDYQEVKSTITKYFGGFKRRSLPDQVEDSQTIWPESKKISLDYPAEPILAIAYQKPPYPNQDDIKLNLWLDYMFGSRSAPIFKELVFKQKLAGSIGFYEAPGTAFKNLYVISAVPAQGVSNQELTAAILKQISEKLLVEPKGQRLEAVKKALSYSFIKSLESNEAIAGSLASNELLYGDWRYFYYWLSMIEKVSPADIAKTAAFYLNRNTLIVQLENSNE